MSKWDIGTSGNLSSNELSPADSQLCGNTIAVNVSPIGVLGDHTKQILENHGTRPLGKSDAVERRLCFWDGTNN
jgi:hypothetical protein